MTVFLLVNTVSWAIRIIAGAYLLGRDEPLPAQSKSAVAVRLVVTAGFLVWAAVLLVELK